MPRIAVFGVSSIKISRIAQRSNSMRAPLVPTRRLFTWVATHGTIRSGFGLSHILIASEAIMWAILTGAALIIGGLLFLFTSALGRRPSDPHQMPQGGTTLEPRRQGLRFLGISKNWPALAVIALGALLLAFGGYS